MKVKKAGSEEGWFLESEYGHSPRFVSMSLALYSAQHDQTNRCTQ